MEFGNGKSASAITTLLPVRMLLFSTKSVFEQTIGGFYLSDFKQKCGSRRNRASGNRLIACAHGFYNEVKTLHDSRETYNDYDEMFRISKTHFTNSLLERIMFYNRALTFKCVKFTRYIDRRYPCT